MSLWRRTFPHPPPPTFQCFPKLRVCCPQNSVGTMAALRPSAGSTGSVPCTHLEEFLSWRAGRDRAVESELQGQEGSFPRSLAGRQTSGVQGVGGNIYEAARRVILVPGVLPALCLKWDLLTKKAKGRSLWASCPSLGPSFLSERVWCSVALCVLRCCVAGLQRGRHGHTGDRWDAGARCQARSLSRKRGRRPQPSGFPSLQGQARLPPKAP